MTNTYHLITRKNQLQRVLDHCMDVSCFAFDTETNSLDVLTATPFLLAIHATETFIIDLTKFQKEDLQKIAVLFETSSITKIAHNSAYDWKILYHHYGIYTRSLFDTLLAEKLLYAGLRQDNGLDDVLYRRYGIVMEKETRKTFINKTDTTFTEAQYTYTAQDVKHLQTLMYDQLQELSLSVDGTNLLRVMSLENSIIDVTAMMELTGIPLNKSMLEEMHEPFERYIEQVDRGFQDMLLSAGVVNTLYITPDGYKVINSSSGDQVLPLFHALGIDVDKLDSKVIARWDVQHSKLNKKMDVDYSEVIHDEDVSDSLTSFTVLENKYLRAYAYLNGLRKILSTYIVGLTNAIHPVTGRIHAGFNQLGAEATGRYSSSSPNFQNMPNDTKFERLGLSQYSIRKCIEAPKGRKLIISDYSGIELVILAVLSGDDDLLHQITQGDIHLLVTREVLGYKDITPKNKKESPHKQWRDASKKLSYSIAYGTTGRNAAETLNIDLALFGYKITPQQGDELIEKWYKLFPKTAAYLQENAKKAQTPSQIIRKIPVYVQDGFTDKKKPKFKLTYKEEKVSFVTDTWGRRRYWRSSLFFGANNDERKQAKWKKLAAGREGMNAPIQGTSATMTKRAMYYIHNRLDLRKARIIITVHDEIVVETLNSYESTATAIIKWGMEEAIRETLPAIAHMVGQFESLSAAPKSSQRYDK